MNEKAKTVAESVVQQIQVVMPEHINTLGNLFGGQLLYWIDLAAGLVAFRHTGGHCPTAAFDEVRFLKPIVVKDVLLIEGHLTYIGNSSMEVRVNTFVEKRDRKYEFVNSAYITSVYVDENGHPKRAPRLELLSDEEVAEWNAGMERARIKKETRLRDNAAPSPLIR